MISSARTSHLLLYTLSNGLVKMATLLSIFFLASATAKDFFGLATHINMCVQTLAVLLAGGIPTYLNRSLSRESASEDIAACTAFYIVLLAAVGIAITSMSGFFRDLLFSGAISEGLLLIIFGAACILALVSLLSNFLVGRGAYRIASRLNICYAIAYACAFLVFANRSLESFLLAISLPSLLYLVIYIYVAKYKISDFHRIVKSFSFASMKRIASFCFPALISSFFFGPVIFLMHAKLLDNLGSASSIADFNLAYQVRMMIYFLPSIFISSSISAIVQASPSSRAGLLRNLGAISGALFIGAVIFIEMFRHLDEVWNPLRSIPLGLFLWNYLVAFLMVANGFVGALLIAKARMWQGLIFNFAWAAVAIILNEILLKQGFSTIAPLAGLAVAYAVLSVIQFFYLAKSKK